MKKINPQTNRIRYLLRRPALFSIQTGNIQLRPYQEQAIQAVIESVVYNRGMEFTWIFPRQSGKDESLAVLVQYLLTRAMSEGAEMVFFNPTFKPQTETSMRRLETRLQSNVLTKGKWKRKSGYIYQMGNAFCTYLSGDPSANTVGGTANLLLVVNEAQDISTFKYDKDIEPMVASANATRLFSGTRWTNETLLEREYMRSLDEEKQDGFQRVFFFTAEDVRKWVPAYGAFVDGVVQRLGRQHPLVKTQYFCETIDAQAGMFPPGRQALVKGTHAARMEPEAGKTYAFLIDVAGQDEGGRGRLPQKGRTHWSAPTNGGEGQHIFEDRGGGQGNGGGAGEANVPDGIPEGMDGGKACDGVRGAARIGEDVEADPDRDRCDGGGGGIVELAG
jgi:hypothetical protein